MSPIEWLTAALTIVIAAYLVYALFFPERF